MKSKKEVTKKEVEKKEVPEVIDILKTESKYDESEYKWYILSSNSGKEKRVAELIKQRAKANGISDMVPEAIVPTQDKIVIKKGKKETIEDRILPGYILIKVIPNDDVFQLIKTTEGVAGFVSMSAKSKTPSPIPEKQIEGILAYMKVKQSPVFSAKFNIGEAIKVVEGPFKDFIGTVQEIDESKGQVTALLSIFGQDTPVHLDFLQISKL